ncbi:MAG: helix-turn-helix domain-containing protein [Pseudomonadales bacterium]|nr:helix-turn-helix domain-containing protein [Pseudomonadales bacterium]
MVHSKTKTSFYRRLYVAHLIASGCNTVPAITKKTGMPRRTAQDTIKALPEIDVMCEFVGATKDGAYQIVDWGPINQDWLLEHLNIIKDVLGYPASS